ncbi:hypothetical protein F9278_10880 [Streptomyces phaeolivaceus]|uniref:Uncharacterized protein n=1 Tax=Streptomyces phaeolivaceus TaxID=2653200 RepID=A0A5P8K0H9_9ACTN|nr:hypothetical protein [Streptomyces phaeolivaceus]QFQ96641.1 hypothetical protein F9278_10880 [Streptomyces phaeolivaceus]
MSAFLIAAVVIFLIMSATVAFTVKVLSSTPARIGVVITAFAGLVIAFPPILRALDTQAPATSPPAVEQPSPQSGATGEAGAQ